MRLYKLLYTIILISMIKVCIAQPNQDANTAEVVIFSNIMLDKLGVENILKQADNNSKDQVLVILGFELQDTINKQKIIDYASRLKDNYKKCYLLPSPALWSKYNASGIKMLDDLFDDEMSGDMLLPDNACGELETKNINDNLVLAIMDSNWYLQNWDKDRYTNKGCYIKDRNRFWMYFNDEISSFKDKTVLLLTYHDPISYDASGGYIPMIKTLIPIPIIGAYIQKIKSYTKGINYATHPTYREFSSGIKKAVDSEINIISVAASGKYQMYYKKKDNHFLNVDSGVSDSEFIQDKLVNWSSRSKAKLKLKKNADGIDAQWLDPYSSNILNKINIPFDREIADLTNASSYSLPDSVKTSVLADGTFKNLNGVFFGQLNTDLYKTEVKVPSFNMESEEGNTFSTEKIGGGKQTISVRIKGQNEKEFVLRSLKKSPDKLIPPPFDIDAVKYLVSYFFTAANPFSFLVSAQLEQDLGLNSTDAELYYLPKQSSLEPYNDEIGDQLVLFKQRADGDNTDVENFDNSEDIISTKSLLDDYWENKANVDAKAFLKCRLLDILINDWDRHEDQWRWAKPDNDSLSVDYYGPIPRDRDQALSHYDGVFLSLVSYYSPYAFPATSFGNKIEKKDIRRNHYIASFLDNFILGQLDKREWDAVAQEFEKDLTDDIIKNSFNALPKEIRSHQEDDVRTLINRRSEIAKVSDYLFQLVNEKLLVLCSENKDSIVINTSDNVTSLKVYSYNKDDEKLLKIERDIYTKSVEEMWIYALEGDDELTMTGDKPSMHVIYISGYGNDRYKVEDKIESKLEIYEIEDTNVLSDDEDERIHKTNHSSLISINREDFRQDYGWILPGVSFNSDDGILINALINRFTFGFKRMTTHTFKTSFATFRTSSTFEYNLLLSNELKANDIFLDVAYYGPRYEANYFGLGNNSVLNTEIDDSFYFLRQKVAYVIGGLKRTFMDGGNVSVGLGAQRMKLDGIGGRFVDTDDAVDPMVFDNHYFAHGQLKYSFSNFDNTLIPHNGFSFDVDVNAGKSLSDNTKDYIKLEASTKVMSRVITSERLIIGSKIGGGYLISDDPFIYSLFTLGGNSLRGYRRDRFRGSSYFYNKNNVHYYINKKTDKNDRKNSMGVSAFFDHGRVWHESDITNRWRYSYGTGVFFNPLDVIVISLAYNISPEEARISLRLGWQL